MRVIILTSSDKGTASHHLEYLLKSKQIHVCLVVQNTNAIAPRNKWKKKFRKLRKIGVLGAWNGMRMRKWYNGDLYKYLRIKSIAEVCREHSIPLRTVRAINQEETRKLFREAGADLGISLGNGYIPKSVFSIPANGMINIHHEELPAFQNAQSVIWQLYTGSNKTGFTIHEIDSRIDTGNILYKETMDLEFRETLSDTVTYNLARLYEKSAIALVNVLEHYKEYKNNAYVQQGGISYTTPSFRNFIRIKKQYRELKNRSAKT
ncbi:MAG TPA: formyltransferase family protein [Flavobacteriales bacterium]|nr:formyltransferase family protein [Flavobacteriales bacterium]